MARRKQYIARLTHRSGTVAYVDRTCALTPSRDDAVRYDRKRDAESMGDHLCRVAAFNGDDGWSATVEEVREP